MKFSESRLIARLAAVAISMLLLASCSDEDVDELCVNPLAIADSPDMTIPPTITDTAVPANTITTATPGQAVVLEVPVDSETRSVFAGFAQVGTTTFEAAPAYADTADRIIDGTAETVSINLNAPSTAGSYYAIVVLCVDTAATVMADASLCGTTGRYGTGYADDSSDVVTSSNYARVRALTGGTYTAPYLEDPAIDPTFARNSCIPVKNLTVAP